MPEVNFLARCHRTEPERSDTNVGLMDGQNGSPAYSTTDSRLAWVANVHNNDSHTFCFVPIDHNIEMLDGQGNMMKRCDGMLLCEETKYIAFVELKEVRTGGQADAVRQLEETIKVFHENHNYRDFLVRRAYAANRRHPHFHYSSKTTCQRFWSLYRFRLYEQAQIDL